MRIDTNTSNVWSHFAMRAYAPQAMGPIARIRPDAGAVPSEQSAEEAAPAHFPEPAQRLVGGLVPGRVDFAAGEARHDGTLQLYRHPADRNAAATGVSVGRRLDVQG